MPASKHRIDLLSSSLVIARKAIMYLPFLSFNICCFFERSFNSSFSLIFVAFAFKSKDLAKSHISFKESSLSSILNLSGISLGPMWTPNCLATRINDFWEPRIASIFVFNHIKN